jgi:transcriptional regulator with XRE-family HTH domain
MKTLREIRKEAGVSQRTLAERLGGETVNTGISFLETGTVSPSIRRLRDVLNALGFELRIQAVRHSPHPVSGSPPGSEPIFLAVESLIGKPPRAKDARRKANRTEPLNRELPRAKDAEGESELTDLLEKLIKG